LTKNEQNCFSLVQQIKSLEHKYQSLEEDRVNTVLTQFLLIKAFSDEI